MAEVIAQKGEIKVSLYRKGYVGLMIKVGSDEEAKKVYERLNAALTKGTLNLSLTTKVTPTNAKEDRE